MPVLDTPEAVMNRVGVAALPIYSVLEPMLDCAGFAVRRPLPTNTAIGKVRSQDGKPTVTCVVQFIVDPPRSETGISRVLLHVFPFDRWHRRHIPPWLPQYDFADPECPSESSVADYQQAPRPLDLSFATDFIYDTGEDQFYDDKGARVTGEQILDFVYEYHCRTLRSRFRLKYRLQQGLASTARGLAWHGQTSIMWVLREAYDVTPVGDDLRRSPFHEFSFRELTRATDEGTSHFFGFRSSRRSLLPNMLMLTLACLAGYYLVPRLGFLRAVYANTALTTAALLLICMATDLLMPIMLRATVCVLSRLRRKTMFLFSKVKA